MDKAWVNLPRMTEEYRKAVQNFVYSQAENEGNPEKVICPCIKCRNLIRHSPRDVVSDLVCFGIDPTYDVWIFHGEARPSQNVADEGTNAYRMYLDAQIVDEGIEDHINKKKRSASTIDRDDLCKTYRRNNGEPPNAVVAECTTKIKEHNNTNGSQGTISLSEDGVAKLFDKERYGRIRGLGFGVTPPPLGVHTTNSKKLSALENQVTRLQNTVQELRDLITTYMAGKENLVADPSTPRATAQSLGSSTFPNNGIQLPRKCKLLGWQKKVVAEGTLVSIDPTALVHHVPLEVDNWKVRVDVPVDPQALLWRKTSKASNIQQALGTAVAWHKDFVVVVD